MTKNLNTQIYDEHSRSEYLQTMERIGMKWLKVFKRQPEDKSFWDAAYWDLFTKLSKTERGIKKTDAIS